MTKRALWVALIILIAGLIVWGSLRAWARPLVARHTTRGPCVALIDPKPRMTTTRIEALVHAMYRCVQHRYGVPGGFAWLDCTGDRESSDYPWAHGGGYSYLGLFQHAAGAWTSRARTYLERSWFPRSFPPSAFNERANAIVTARMVRRLGTSAWGGGCRL